MGKRLLLPLLLLFALLIGACSILIQENEVEVEESEVIIIPETKTGIIIGTSDMTGLFSPFYEGGAGDAEVMNVINAPLVTLDRRGEVIRSAGVGEKSFFNGTEYEYSGIADIGISLSGEGENETTVLVFNLREDIYFSDGEKMTADDLIFTLYAFCDVDYKGHAGVSLLPIEGLDYYRADVEREIYAEYAEIAAACLDALEAEEENGEGFTPEQLELFYECYREAWLSHVKAVIEHCARNYADFSYLIAEGDIHSDEWLRVALAMMVWRVADFPVLSPAVGERDTVYGAFTSVSGREWDFVRTFPTAEDFFEEFYALYEGNLSAYINAEKIGSPLSDNPMEEAKRLFIQRAARADEAENSGVNRISGIRKIGDYDVRVTLYGHIPSAVYSFVFPVAPLHHYGDALRYDYGNNAFGFTRGDLSAIREKSHEPLGAGPYKLTGFDELYERTAFLEANEFYYKGTPQTAQISFTQTEPHDLIYGTAAGFYDIAAVAATREIYDEIDAYQADGAEILQQEAYFGALGYIGINARRVNIDEEPLSEESVNFRKGIATVFAAYREISVRDYFGEAADVAQYPVSGVSWAAPRRGDLAFRTAFAVSVDGTGIYNTEMSEAMRLEAAKKAALDYFEAAGCELNAARTSITEFPEDVSNSYEVYITGGSAGKHPSYLLLTMTSDMLRSVGINLIIKDVSSQAEMYQAVLSGEADMWCAAWNGEVLSGIRGRFSSLGAENYFGLSDEVIDQRITIAGASLTHELYKSALDAVLDSAVIIPVYQRKMNSVFGGALDHNTIEGDLTAHYGYADVIWKIKILSE